MSDYLEDPKKWESYFKSLLRLKYGPENVFDVPDSDGGDHGVECFTQCGQVFQCYLPEQMTDKAKLKAAIQGKISKDLKKFKESNVLDIEKLLGGIKVRRWVLGTPAFLSAELQSYCSKKTFEVKESAAPYLDKNFRVMIQTDGYYPEEQARLFKEKYEFSLDIDPSQVQDAVSFIQNEYNFLKKIDMKLPKIFEEKDIPRMKRWLVNRYLEYQNYKDKLLAEYSEIWSLLDSSVRHREIYLEEVFFTDPNAKPNEIIKSQIAKLSDDVKGKIPTISKSNVDLIRWGVLTDWLIRCPLDFEDAD